MRKTNLLWAFILLLVVCLSSCSSEPKDAKECVMQFLQCLKENDVEQGEKITEAMLVNKNGKTASIFTIARKYTPNWEPNKVVLSEQVDTITINKNKLAVVYATCNDKEASFYVSINESDSKQKYSINNTDGFLNLNSITTSKSGVKITKGSNSNDFDFLYHAVVDVDDVTTYINKFYKSRNNEKELFKLYPNAKSFGDYLIVDSIIPQIKEITINLNKQWEIYNYVAICTNGNTFYVQQKENNSYIITNSKGIYDFDKKIVDLCEKYDYYEYYPDAPNKDIEAKKAADKEEKEIKKRVAERKRTERLMKAGLVVYSLETVRGKDRDGDPSTGFEIRLANPTNKTIKYLVFYTVARNGVDDVTGRKTCQGIGPIEPLSSGTYNFSDLYYDYNSIIKSVSISNIEIIYTDGSRKNSKWSDVKY